MTDAGLDVDRLVEQATDATGLDDFGEPTWQEGLEHLVPSLRDEARLNELGEQIAIGGIVELLSNRLAITRWRAEHPEVAAGDVTPPIVIVGQARTGTTILFDLLAQDPATRSPLTWEIDRPVPPPETATFDTDPRIDEVDAILSGVDLLMPGFRTMHPMGARLAAGVREHHQLGLPQRHLPDPVPGAVVREVGDVRGRHGARVPLAPPVPPAPAVPPPGGRSARGSLAGEVAGAHLVPRRADRRVPGRADGADPPRPAAHHRVAVVADVDLARDDLRRPEPRPRSRPSGPSTSSKGSTGP